MELKTKNNPGGVLPFVVTVILFGLLVPWWKGLDAFDPILFLVSLLVPLVFVTPIATSAGAQLTAMSRAGRAFLYSALLTLLIAFHSIAIVNITHWFGHLILPPMGVLLSGCLAALLAEACLALFAVWLFAHTTAVRVLLIVRLIFFAVLLTYLYLFRFAPPDVRAKVDEHMTSELITQSLLQFAAVIGIAAIAFGTLVRRSTRRV